MKTKEELKIVFMGTPEFAAFGLEQIIQDNYTVVGVVTVPDKPAGRGQKIRKSAVKRCAEKYNLPVLQPGKLKDPEFIDELYNLNADVFVVVAFRMLPKVIWKLPPLGTFNLHGSLLPKYRGAAPIHWAVINGETETGVTTFFIDEEIDTGEIILQKKMPIATSESTGDVHDGMMIIGSNAIIETLELIRLGSVNTYPQPDEEVQYAPKLQKIDSKVDFGLPIERLYNFIRGMSPYPAAWMEIKHTSSNKIKRLKVYKSTIYSTNKNDVVQLCKVNNKLILKSLQGELELINVHLEGKKRMESSTFLLGFNPDEWLVINQ